MGDPGPRGRFGSFGGRFVPEALVPACEQLEAAFRAAWADAGFRAGLAGLQRSYAGRPTPVTEATRLSEALGVRVLLKREDLAHTGSHKINNALGQGLLAQRVGKTALVAETGAGQHGVATATVAVTWAWAARCTWGRRTSRGRNSTCSGWNCSGRPWCPSPRGRARSRTRPARRCGTG